MIERTGIANAASGKSGGFLALDWCDGSPVEALARRSFALHARLGTAESTTQLDLAAFTGATMRAALTEGARMTIGTVSGVVREADGAVRGVVVDGQELAGDSVVFAMGPWSVLASNWLPLPAIYGLKGHSLVFCYAPEPAPHALFVEPETEGDTIASPEVMPRPDGTTYVCGLSSEQSLPVDPAAVVPDEGGCDRLRAMTAQFAPALGGAEVLAEQACYRPVVEDGLLLIGAVPGAAGAYVATAHSVWGMLNGPATGEAVAEL